MANTPHPSPRLISPVTGAQATQERTDQGVDWGSIRGNIVAVGGGVITAVYDALSGFGTTVIERLSSGQYVYYAGETGAGAPVVQAGQQVQQGQEIAPGLGTGGIEVGYWDPATGHAAGYQPGTVSGGVTAAGTQFLQDISGSPAPNAGGQQSDLAQLWVQAGGNPALANLMAAIAMAESGGNIGAVNQSSGASGLWQINPSAWPQYDANRLRTDALYNAQAAVAVEKAQGLTAWSTYTSGAYRQFLGKKNVTKGGAVRPGGEPVGQTQEGQGVIGMFDHYSRLRDMPRTAPPGTRNPAQWFLASFTDNWNALPPPTAAGKPLSGTGA